MMATTEALLVQNQAEIELAKQQLLDEILPTEIVSPQEYAAIAAFQGKCDTFLKEQIKPFDDVCKKAYDAWQGMNDLRKRFFDPVRKLNERARTLLGDYDLKREQARREEERRRIEEEQRRVTKEREREAKTLEKQGRSDEAEAVRTAPPPPIAAVVPKPEQPEGLSYRDEWKWRIAGCLDVDGGKKDKSARTRAALLVPRQYLDLDDVKINRAVANDGELTKIPGIEVYKVRVPVRR